MADAALVWGGDFGLTASGDLAISDGDAEVRDRILRRLLTAVKGYTFHLEYGAGLPQRIGKVARAQNIRALVRANIALETTVSKVPVPTITVDEDETVAGLFNIYIGYVDAATGAPVALSFEVPSN